MGWHCQPCRMSLEKSSVSLLFLDRFRMTCSEARHWISVLHSDWTNSPTLYQSVLHENDDQGKFVESIDSYLLFTAGGLGLLLALVLLVTGRAGKGLLENLKNLLILELLVRLDLLDIDGLGSSELGETVLGNGCGCG